MNNNKKASGPHSENNGVTSVSNACEVKVRFFPPPRELRRYFTTFYLAEWTVSGEGTIVDYLLPEWANLRFHSGSLPDSTSRTGARLAGTSFPATGPSSEALRFEIGSSRMWGVGLLPLGWAKFVGANAADFANLAVDGFNHPAFASFAELARSVYGRKPDPLAELGRIERHFLDRIGEPVADEERIHAIHAALVDPETKTVAGMVERAGIGQRTVERICSRNFGFPPKLLLRHQRFMRSLSHFMLDPSLKWIGAIDGNYHDQAQFVRDFRQFMGMSPRQFAALDKPVIGVVMRERMRFFSSPVQTLDSPDGPSALG